MHPLNLDPIIGMSLALGSAFVVIVLVALVGFGKIR